jgi:hypothetical protein
MRSAVVPSPPLSPATPATNAPLITWASTKTGKGRVSLDLGKRKKIAPSTKWRSWVVQPPPFSSVTRKINKTRGKGNTSSNLRISSRTTAADPDLRKSFEEDGEGLILAGFWEEKKT